MPEEEPLEGGNVAATVMRVGDTVRKPVTAHTPATKAILDALETTNVAGVPRFHGIDQNNRQILSFIPGSTAFPADMWQQTQTLCSAAQLLRRIHDASAALVNHDLPWAYCYPIKSNQDVIGHGDFAPYNMTFSSDGTVSGVFDFDLAGPAPRTRDLAYLAWWLVPLGQQDPAMKSGTMKDVTTGSLRLITLCEAYGTAADETFLAMVDHILDHMSDPSVMIEMIGQDAADTLIADGHLAHWAVAKADFAQVRPKIAANLSR